MSIRFMSAVWADDTIQSRTQLLILLTISDFANDDGVAWPSIETIAKKSRTKQRAVQERLDELKQLGKLEIRTGAGPKGTNVYRVIVGGVQQMRGASTAETIPGLDAPDPSGTVTKRQKLEKEAAEIYEGYPKKVARPAAIRAILKALEKTPAETLKQAVFVLREKWAGEALDFMPHPATWFNQQRYLDPQETWGPRKSFAAPRPPSRPVRGHAAATQATAPAVAGGPVTEEDWKAHYLAAMEKGYVEMPESQVGAAAGGYWAAVHEREDRKKALAVAGGAK